MNHPDLKFLFMSGHPAKVGARIPVLAGDGELLRKPFGRGEFSVALRVALESSRGEKFSLEEVDEDGR